MPAVHRVSRWPRLFAVDSLAFGLVAEIGDIECVEYCGVFLVSV